MEEGECAPMTQQATETVLNASGDETIQSTEWMKWQYDFSTKMKLRYAVDVAKTNGDCTDNFVKSIRMCPNGCSFLYSLEDGTVRQVDLREIDFWGVQAEPLAEPKEASSLEKLREGEPFNHTEIVYSMDW